MPSTRVHLFAQKSTDGKAWGHGWPNIRVPIDEKGLKKVVVFGQKRHNSPCSLARKQLSGTIESDYKLILLLASSLKDKTKNISTAHFYIAHSDSRDWTSCCASCGRYKASLAPLTAISKSLQECWAHPGTIRHKSSCWRSGINAIASW